MTRLMMAVAVAAVALDGLAAEPPALHPIFRDGMVFAAGKPMRIYGSGKGDVKVTFRGGTYAAEDAADGWRVTLPPASPAGAETLTVDLDGRRMELRDVRLGEVFLAAGQSNWRVMFSESTTDLTAAAGEPVLLFNAALGGKAGFVTDGPWMFTDKSGALQMLWSSMIPSSGGRYGVLQTTSKSGRLAGPWSDTKVLLDDDEGHCMLFTDLGGQLRLAFHGPNSVLNERMRTVPCEITSDGLHVRRTQREPAP